MRLLTPKEAVQTPGVGVTFPCAHATCQNHGSVLLVHDHPLRTLFDSQAGIVCDEHATEYEGIGAIRVPDWPLFRALVEECQFYRPEEEIA